MSITLPQNIELPQENPLASLLGGLGTGIQQGSQFGLQEMMKQQMKQQQQQAQLKQLMSILGMSDQPQADAQGMPSAEGAPSQKSPQMSNIEKVATNPQAMLALSQTNPQAANQVQKMYENQLAREKFDFAKEKEERKAGLISPERREDIKGVLTRQLELLGEGNIGFGKAHKLYSEKGREARSEFNTLSTAIEAQLATMVGKGTLSKARFEFIKANLPKASDSQAKIRGKIKAFQREFKIDLPGMKGQGTKGIKTQSFNVGGKTFNIPGDKVEEFKKDMGIN